MKNGLKRRQADKNIATRRVDGWQNILTGLGVLGKDKRMSAMPAPRQFQRQECDDLYRADDICRKVVHKLPDEAFREGYQFQTADDSSKEQVEWLEKRIRQLNLNALLQKAWWTARLYGGSAIVLGIEDGQDMSEPVNFNGIKTISWANVFDRWQLTYHRVQKDFTKQDYNKPDQYRLTTYHGTTFSNGQNVIHRSRMIIFDGHELTDYEFIRNAYWNASILESIFQPLSNFNSAHDGSAALVGDFAQSVYKLKNLTELLSQDRDDLVMKRLALIDKTRSVVNALVIEEGEEFERKTTNVSGLSELIDRTGERLVAATEMPHNLIMGDGAKGGLGSEGQTENRDWYDTVAAYQANYLKPRLDKAINFLQMGSDSPSGGVIDPKVKIVFKALWQASETDIVSMRFQQAQADQIYLTTGVLDPEEVAQSRFGGAEYSIETNLLADRDALNDVPNDPLPAPQQDVKTDGLYQNIDCKPPVEVMDTLAIGLQQVARYMPELASSSAVNLARDLVNGVSIGPMRIIEWCEFFARIPAPDAATRDAAPNAELIGWNLHGGEWGSMWAQELRKKMLVEESNGDL